MREAREAEGRRARDGRVMLVRVYDVPYLVCQKRITAALARRHPYGEQSQGNSSDELGDAYRARHVCSLESVLFLQERPFSSGGGKGCPVPVELNRLPFSGKPRVCSRNCYDDIECRISRTKAAVFLFAQARVMVECFE